MDFTSLWFFPIYIVSKKTQPSWLRRDCEIGQKIHEIICMWAVQKMHLEFVFCTSRSKKLVTMNYDHFWRCILSLYPLEKFSLHYAFLLIKNSMSRLTFRPLVISEYKDFSNLASLKHGQLVSEVSTSNYLFHLVFWLFQPGLSVETSNNGFKK